MKVSALVALLVVLAFSALLTVGLIFVFSDKSITGYYLQKESIYVPGVCVYADTKWYADSKAFCSESVNDAGQVYERLRSQLNDKSQERSNGMIATPEIQ